MYRRDNVSAWQTAAVTFLTETRKASTMRRVHHPGYRGVHHRARIRATRWLIRATGPALNLSGLRTHKWCVHPGKTVTKECAMKALKASIRVAVAALALSLSP